MSYFLKISFCLKMLLLLNSTSILAVFKINDTPLAKRYPVLLNGEMCIGLNYPAYRTLFYTDDFDKKHFDQIRSEESRDSIGSQCIITEFHNLFPFQKAEYNLAAPYLLEGKSYHKSSYQHFILKEITFDSGYVQYVYRILKEDKLPSYLPGDRSEAFQTCKLACSRRTFVDRNELLDTILKDLKNLSVALPKLSSRILMADAIIRWMESCNYLIEKVFSRSEDSSIAETCPPNNFWGHFMQCFSPDLLGYYAAFFAKNDVHLFPEGEREIALEGKNQFFACCNRFFYLLSKKNWPEYPPTNYVMSFYKWILGEEETFSPFLKKLILKDLPFEYLTVQYEQLLIANRYAHSLLYSKTFNAAKKVVLAAEKKNAYAEYSLRKIREEILSGNIDPLHVFFDDYGFFYRKQLFAKAVSPIARYIEKYFLMGDMAIFKEIRYSTQQQMLSHFIEHKVLCKINNKYVIDDALLVSLLNVWIKSFQGGSDPKKSTTLTFDNLLVRLTDPESFKMCYGFCAQMCDLTPTRSRICFQYSLAHLIQTKYPEYAEITKNFSYALMDAKDKNTDISEFVKGLLFYKGFHKKISENKKQEPRVNEKLEKRKKETEGIKSDSGQRTTC